MNVREQRITEAIARYAATADYDLSRWPEDVTGTVALVCELWHLRPPEAKKSKAYWIQQTRELMDASGEWGDEAVRQYRRDFEDYMDKHGGIAQHTVEGPGSLVKMVRAKAALMRESGLDRAARSRNRYAEE